MNRQKNNIKRFLLAFDFDGTIAQTFARSPNGLGVNEAYAEAISRIFGKIGLEVYRQMGGLKNRAPGELVLDMLNSNPELIDVALEYFFSADFAEIKDFGLVPANKGVPLVWDKTNPSKVVGEMLVWLKLLFLNKEIGKTLDNGQSWPEPCNGFIDFCKAIAEINKKGVIYFDLAILSSGHDFFIQQTFDSWGLTCPEIMVTDDDIRGLDTPVFKPNSRLFELLHWRWLQKLQPSFNQVEMIDYLWGKNKIAYFGDDPKKDEELARNYGVFFAPFYENDRTPARGILTIKDWRVLADFLRDHQQELAETGSLRDLLNQ